MNKELQDKVWSALPKEYREEVRKLYTAHVRRQVITAQDPLLEKLFGRENLSSDEEPETLNLSMVKDKVDDWFDGHTPEETYDTLVKYGMKPDGDSSSDREAMETSFANILTDKEVEKLAVGFADAEQEIHGDRGYREELTEMARMVLKYVMGKHTIIRNDFVKKHYDFWFSQLPRVNNLAQVIGEDPEVARMFGQLDCIEALFTGTDFYKNVRKHPLDDVGLIKMARDFSCQQKDQLPVTDVTALKLMFIDFYKKVRNRELNPY